MAKEKKGLNEEQLAILDNAFPVAAENTRPSYPRFGMLSKDIVEESGSGKKKKITVIQPAGTFYTEKDMGDIDEDTGKKVWTKTFIEDEETVDVIIAYHRRQLRKYDSSLEKFISSPIFDNATQVIPLYLDKQVIKTGTQAELQACYPALSQKGKPTSDLKEETILYVIYEGEMYQMNLSQSSKWSFKDYTKTVNPSTVITTLGTSEETFGTNTYRKITFTKGRMINGDEFDVVVENQTAIKETVENDAQLFLTTPETADEKLNKEFSS